MKVANLTAPPEGEGEQGRETDSQPDVQHTANPSLPVMHLTKAHLEMMQDQDAHHDGPMQVGHKYEVHGVMHVKGSHEDGGAEVHMTHMGTKRLGKRAHEVMYSEGHKGSNE